jgi:hypothetical protein
MESRQELASVTVTQIVNEESNSQMEDVRYLPYNADAMWLDDSIIVKKVDWLLTKSLNKHEKETEINSFKARI